MASSRAEQLRTLAKRFPAQDERVAKRLQDARAIQLQRQASTDSPLLGGERIREMLRSSALYDAKTQLAARENRVNQLTQLGQLAIREKDRKQRKTLSNKQLALRSRQMQIATRLSQMNQSVKNEVLDQELSFQANQNGRILFKQRQLVDFMLTKGIRAEKLQYYQQFQEQASRRKLQVLQQAHKLLTQRLNQTYTLSEANQDKKLQYELVQMKRNMEKALAETRAAAVRNQTIWQTGGMVLGTIGGALIGGPLGAAAGAAVGRGLGSLLSVFSR